MYKIEFSNLAAKELERIYKAEVKTYNRIMTVIESLAEVPFQGKKLRGKLKGDYSIRVGSYRVIYSIRKLKLLIHIIDVGHRKGIYKIT